jgi:SM-20-related protein
MPIADNIYQHGFHVIDNFLEETHYLELRSLTQRLQNEGNFTPAKIGHQHNKTLAADIRNDQIYWLDEQTKSPAINAYFTELEKISATLNQTLFLGLVDYEAHFAIYQPNNFYKKHVDQFNTAQERRISCVYYLNHEWQQEFGGELQLYDQADQPLTTITPQGNRFICFNSDIPHEVCTAFKTRYSIAAWLKIRPMEFHIR